MNHYENIMIIDPNVFSINTTCIFFKIVLSWQWKRQHPQEYITFDHCTLLAPSRYGVIWTPTLVGGPWCSAAKMELSLSTEDGNSTGKDLVCTVYRLGEINASYSR